MKIQYFTLAALIAISLTAQAEEQHKPTHKQEAAFNGAIALGSGVIAGHFVKERVQVGRDYWSASYSAQLELSGTNNMRQRRLREISPKLAEEFDAVREKIQKANAMPVAQMEALETRLEKLDQMMEKAGRNDPMIKFYNEQALGQRKAVKALELVDTKSQYIKAMPEHFQTRANRAVVKATGAAAVGIVAGNAAIRHYYTDENIENRPTLQEPVAAEVTSANTDTAELPN